MRPGAAYLPAQPFGKAPAQNPLPLFDRQIERVADEIERLSIGARQSREVRSPEDTSVPVRLQDPMDDLVQIVKRICLYGVARQRRRLHGDVGPTGKANDCLDEIPELVASGVTGEAKAVDDQTEVGVSNRDAVDQRQQAGGEYHDGRRSTLGAAPKIIGRATDKLLSKRRHGRDEPVAENGLGRLGDLPRRLARPGPSHYSQPLRVRRGGPDRGAIALRFPERRYQNRRVDTRAVHGCEHLAGCEGGRKVWLSAAAYSVPEVNLSVDDHGRRR